MKWFRTYGDMPDNPKIGTLNDAEFRTWMELLCCACKQEKHGETGLTDETIDWTLRRNVTVTLHTLYERKLIHKNEGGIICITKWEARQKKSDDSSLRVLKYRNKNKCNVTVTEMKLDANSLEKRREEKKEEEKNTKKNPEGFFAFFSLFPKQRKGNREKAEAAYRQALTRSSAEEILSGLKSYVDSDEVRQGMAKGCAAWLNDDRWKYDYLVKKISSIKPNQNLRTGAITL